MSKPKKLRLNKETLKGIGPPPPAGISRYYTQCGCTLFCSHLRQCTDACPDEHKMAALTRKMARLCEEAAAKAAKRAKKAKKG
jgi:hypothetical protein